VTRLWGSNIATHLIPKRMGEDGARDAVARFCGDQAALGIHKFDPRIGIFLYMPLDKLVDDYELGFYYVTEDIYALHNFAPNLVDCSFIGATAEPGSVLAIADDKMPRLHLYTVNLSLHDPDPTVSLPPKGIFDFHYLQCVLTVFATPQYKNLPNVKFFSHPFKTMWDDDSDEEFVDDGVKEPPCPSWRFDRFLAEQGRRQMMLERNEEVRRWTGGVEGGS